MQQITFTKTAIIGSFYDESASKWIDRDLSQSDLPISWYLPYTVEVQEGVTIRDILTLLSKYAEQLDFIFVNYLKTLRFNELVESITSAESKETDEIDSVCLLWVGQIKELLNDEEFELDVYPALMAFEMVDEDKEDEDEDELYSVHDLSPKQLLDSNFVVDELLEYYDSSNPEDEPFGGLRTWTMFDLLSGLLSELTIYSFANGIFPGAEKISLAPLTIPQLFEHLEELDEFFKTNSDSQ